MLFGDPAYENPKYESGGGLLPSGSISQKEFETNYFLIALFWILCAFMLRWAFKLIKARLRPFTGNNVRQIKDGQSSVWNSVRKLIMRLGNRIRFYELLLIHFRQPAGVFARLEQKGKRCGCPRQPGQSPREFLTMLSGETAPEETDARDALSELADHLDLICFQSCSNVNSPPRSPCKTLAAGRIHVILRVTRKHKPVNGVYQ